jgi:hypothetical protein
MRRITATILTATALGLLALPGSARGQDGSEVDPLLDVAADMNAAAVKLAKLHTDTPTQTAQQSALKKLDEIIARLEEEERRGGGNGPVKRPARDSTIMTGPGGIGTLHAEKREGKQWGELPPKERERILQSMNDGFPSHYQRILERYFARLADEKPLADTDAATPAATPTDAAAPAPAATVPAATVPAAGPTNPPAAGEKEAK